MSTNEPNESKDDQANELSIQIIPQDKRADFDDLFVELTGISTPMPPMSEAFMAEQDGNTMAVAYLQVRHVLSPYAVVEDAPAPAAVLDKLLDAVTDQLRSTVRESLLANHVSQEELSANRGLSYDIYVPHGQAGPEGFVRLPVEVWRRRVC